MKVPKRGNAIPISAISQSTEPKEIPDSRYCRFSGTFPNNMVVAQPNTVFRIFPACLAIKAISA